MVCCHRGTSACEHIDHRHADMFNFSQICRSFALNMDKNRSRLGTGLSSLPVRFKSNTLKKRRRAKGKAMFFLLRVAFWLSIVIILLPTGSQQPKSAPTLETKEAVSAASAAVSDMRQFCARQPDACSVGSQAAVAFGYKAQAGAKMLYDFLTDALAPAETGSVVPAGTRKREAAANSQDSLLPGDLTPA